MATIRNVLRPALAYHAIATHSIPGIAAMVAVMSRCTASLLATMISRSQTKTARKRECWFRLRAVQKSYRVIQRANTFVCVQAKIARLHTNPTVIILAPLLEERRIKAGILSGHVDL